MTKPKGLSLGRLGSIALVTPRSTPLLILGAVTAVTVLAVLWWPALPWWQPMLAALALVVALISTVIFHEAGHAIVAHVSGLQVQEVQIGVFGGYTVYLAEDDRRRQMVLTALAGPFASAIAAGGCVLLRLAAAPGTVTYLLLTVFVFLNLAAALANVLPCHPLDGGHVLILLLARVPAKRAWLIMACCHALGVLVLLAAAVALWWYWPAVHPIVAVMLALTAAHLGLVNFRRVRHYHQYTVDEG